MENFCGLTRDAYQFFWEIAFENERGFFEANRKRYEAQVKRPMHLLAAELAQTALSVDPDFVVRPAAVVSRIRRDTRFSRDKSLYRDHAFLTYKHSGMRTGESFVLYAEFERTAYGYGMGMYCPPPQLMADIRKRILTRPALFLSLALDRSITDMFTLSGEDYRRAKYPDAPEALQPYLNKRRMSWCFSSPVLENTMRPELVEEIKRGFMALKPLYRFMMGLE